MSKIAVVTDSNSGITQAQAKACGVTVLPMPFYINEELFLEDITLTQEEFYKKLLEDADISTSQPTPLDVTELWDFSPFPAKSHETGKWDRVTC